MAGSILALPVSVEQVAAVIKQMSPADRRRLLDLVPELRQIAQQEQFRTVEEAQATVEQVRTKVIQALGDQPLSPDELFLDDLTLEQYLDLPDEERARLWEEWGEVEWDSLEELDVQSDALPAG